MPHLRSCSTRYFANIALSIAVCFLLVWAIASLWFPFGWDHGIFASIGDIVIRGGVPYRDGWDMKGPLAYYAYALAQWLFGRNMWGVRVLDIILLLGASISLARIVAQLSRPIAGTWAAIAFALWYASLGWFFTAQPDNWAALVMVLGVVVLGPVSTKALPLRLVICGSLIGCCALIKQLYAVFGIIPLVYLWVLYGGQERQKMFRFALILFISALIPLMVIVYWFASNEALDALIEVHFLYPLKTYLPATPSGAMGRVGSVVDFLVAGKVAIIAPAVVLGVYFLWYSRNSLALPLIAWLVAALFCVVIQGRFFVYHWVPVFPPLVIFAAIGLWALATQASTARTANPPITPGLMVALVSSLLLIVNLALEPLADMNRWFKLVSGKMTSEVYYAGFKEWQYTAGDQIKAAQYIQDRTTELDGLAVWGNDATISFLSGRPNPSRFVFGMPTTRRGGEYLARYKQEYLEALATAIPTYFVVGLPHQSSDKEKELARFAELAAFLRSNYHLEKQLGFLDIYRHNGQ